MKKFFVGAALFGVTVCASAHADEASKKAKIDQLFGLMHMQQVMDQMVQQTQQQTRQALPGMFGDLHFSPAQQKQFDTLMDRVVAISRESLDWNKLQPQFIDLYASTYDEVTVDGLLAFYRSPAGVTMLAKQPELIAKSQGITQARLQEMQPKIRAAMQEFVVELQKEQPAPAAK